MTSNLLYLPFVLTAASQKYSALAASFRIGTRGSSLLELIIAIAVIGLLATLVTPIFASWTNTSSARTCHRNQAKVQESMRAFAAFNRLDLNATLVNTSFLGTGSGMLMLAPTCGGGGTYTYLGSVPPVGTRYASCSITSPVAHVPTNTSGW